MTFREYLKEHFDPQPGIAVQVYMETLADLFIEYVDSDHGARRLPPHTH